MNYMIRILSLFSPFTADRQSEVIMKMCLKESISSGGANDLGNV